MGRECQSLVVLLGAVLHPWVLMRLRVTQGLEANLDGLLEVLPEAVLHLRVPIGFHEIRGL
jgi:hypothetical protein